MSLKEDKVYLSLANQADQDLQIETDFRLNQQQITELAVHHQVKISYLTFQPFAEKVHQYLVVTSERDRVWGCNQDLCSYDYTVYLLAKK